MAERFFLDSIPRQNGSPAAIRTGLTSPRFPNLDSDFPPALSPLDAIAAQSRLMAKQLDSKKSLGRRNSRLTPAAVTKTLSQQPFERPDMLRSQSAETEAEMAKRTENGFGNNPQIARPWVRPISQHPFISDMPQPNITPNEDTFYTPRDHVRTSSPDDYFGAPVAEASDQDLVKTSSFEQQILRIFGDSEGENGVKSRLARKLTLGSQSQPDLASTLVPPRAAFTLGEDQVKARHESSDDDYTSSNAGSTFSFPRKLSSSSGTSAAHSPLSSFVAVHPRSPSTTSETSIPGMGRSRTFLNFSRPRSSASTTNNSTDSPCRKESTNSHKTSPYINVAESLSTFDLTEMPYLVPADGYMSGTGPSYTYAKFSLPRGRFLSRDSTVFRGLSTPHFEWEEPLFQNSPPKTGNIESPLASPSTTRRSLDPKVEPERSGESSFSFEFDRPKTPDQPRTPDQPLITTPLSSPTSSYKSAASTSTPSLIELGDLKTIRAPPPMPIERDDAKSVSSKSNSTVRALSFKTVTTTYQSLTPDDHVTKGIQLHEKGSLKESTYHLRIAAIQNHPTGMLLYALACRHGWGMRPNQRDGVQWLRKAVDSAVMEIAEDEDPSGNASKDVHEKRTRRAQFALSIYELGVSHLNGWGIEQDKALALRCFEIAGNWGDVDALTEAGFCYAEGIGCKKNLKKAAHFYRLAESKGVSMVGNSWIHKDKYCEDEAHSPYRTQPRSQPSVDKSGSKPRNRNIFGRKKSVKAS